MFSRITIAGIVAVWVLVGVSPALADEFTVGVVLESPPSSPAFMDGFQLAVDQSPDVSHPEGTEGGDHLGSMDVVVSVTDATGAQEAVDRTRTMASDAGAAIVVIDVSTQASTAISSFETSAPAMLIVFADTEPGVPTPSSGVFIVGDREMAIVLGRLDPPFDETFTAAYGSAPSPEATRGFVAGRLVDIAVEATDRDPTDIAATRAALDTAMQSGATVQTTTPAIDATPVTTNAPTGDESSQGWSIPPGLIAVIAVVLIIVTGMYLRDARRQERADSE